MDTVKRCLPVRVRRALLAAGFWLAACAGVRGADAAPPPLADAMEFANASFEEDFENDGVPDRWQIPESTQVTLTAEASNGAKAARFTDGYILASQDVFIRDLAGRQVTLRLDAKGTDGAALGCQLGFFTDRGEGKKAFVYARLAWDRALPPAYESVRLRYTFPEKALDGRVWLAFYRSNRQGTVVLDNLQISDRALTPEQQLGLTRLARELGYLATRARAGAERLPAARDELLEAAAAAEQQAERCRDGDVAMLANRDVEAWVAARHAAINRRLCAEAVGVFPVDPCERRPADALGGERPADPAEVVMLQGEYGAVGAEVMNTEDTPREVAITIDAAPGVFADPVIRRQVFMETWYKKAATRLADPLPLLPRDDAGWRLALPPGAVERLYVGFRAAPDAAAGAHDLTLRFQSAGAVLQPLVTSVRVLPAALPTTPRLEHMQFLYTDMEPALSHPAAVAADLAAHGVSAIEFPYIPKVTFSAEGALVTNDIATSPQAEWLRIYGAHIERLAIFWEGRYTRFPLDGQAEAYLPYTDDQGRLTPAFSRAYGELLQAWLRFAAEQGFGPERFLMIADDEPSSKADYKEAPGPEVRRTLELYRLTRQAAPALPIAVTLSDYAMPTDAAVIAQAADVVMPVWPYRKALSRWAPDGYSPRETFRETIFPMLDGLRAQKDLRIWSYRVDAGKSEDVLISARAYPVIAVAAGFTGIATWAYNVKRGMSWDDTDEGLLDYIFAYDGTEDHPLNREVNPAGEVVVPSVRWEALRLGWQDGQVLLALLERSRQRPDPALTARLEKLLEAPRRWAHDPETADYPTARALSREVRRLYAEP